MLNHAHSSYGLIWAGSGSSAKQLLATLGYDPTNTVFVCDTVKYKLANNKYIHFYLRLMIHGINISNVYAEYFFYFNGNTCAVRSSSHQKYEEAFDTL